MADSKWSTQTMTVGHSKLTEERVYGFLCPYCRKRFGLWQSAVDHIRAVHAIEEHAVTHGEGGVEEGK